ncbi:hypothetical protein [Steroidobacter cummioxidans]|uniref:hypothetical protein n=1 Tax=Steroidobacter cummioxidans TaxID=1803913 RepID=UPI00129032C2|nr:hypothetical protein [Steroidobacter cummioxidans]
MGAGEETFVSNAFGTVTSRRVIYHAARGWLGGGAREDIPLNHVTSVRLEISRSVLLGILLLLIGLSLLGAATTAGNALLGLLSIVCAILAFWGSPTVAVNTAGQDRQAARGTPWQRGEANAFVEALRSQLFKEQN